MSRAIPEVESVVRSQEFAEPIVEFADAEVTYPGKQVTGPAVVNVNLRIRKGTFVTVVGPSGCGKSTLLHVCSGLMKPSAGTFRYLGQEWKGPVS